MHGGFPGVNLGSDRQFEDVLFDAPGFGLIFLVSSSFTQLAGSCVFVIIHSSMLLKLALSG